VFSLPFVKLSERWRCLPLALLLPVCAQAAPDPFDTENPIPPVIGLGSETAITPCQLLPENAPPLVLADVVDQALCHNPQTREAWASSRYSAAQVGMAQAAYLPSLVGSVERSRSSGSPPGDGSNWTKHQNDRSATVKLSYLLLDFGGRKATLTASRSALEEAIATQDSVRQQVFLSAVTAFYQVHAYRAALEAAKVSEASALESYKSAQAGFDAGTATPLDRLQAKTAYSQAQLETITAAGQLKNAYGALANVMGLPADRKVELEPLDKVLPDDRNFKAEVGQLIAEAQRQRPDLQAARANLEVAKAKVDIERSAGLPTLSLSGSIPEYQHRSSNAPDDGFTSHSRSIGITLNIPIFSGFADSYRIRGAEANVEAAEARLAGAVDQVALDVWQGYQNLMTATQSLTANADLLESAKAAERVARGRYQAGVGMILDLLTAQTALANARLSWIRAAYDWQISRASLAQAIGALDARFLTADAASANANHP
jgi:TolC family type I secretion outer membrane protein